MKEKRLVKKCYLMFMNFEDEKGQNMWATEIKNLLLRNGFGYVWQNQCVSNKNNYTYVHTKIKRRISPRMVVKFTH
jgi:hypothetical protein